LRGRWPDLAAPAVLVALVLVMGLPLLSSVGYFSLDPDWTYHYALHEIARRALVADHAYPLWTPYVGGGFPIFAHPEFPAPTPQMLVALALGPVGGLKIVALCFWAIAALGTYGFARAVLRVGRIEAMVAGSIVAGSTWFPQRLLSGNMNELYFAFLPCILACLWCASRGGRRLRYFVGLVGLLAWALVDGKGCVLVLGLYAGLCAVLWPIGKKAGRWSWDFRPLLTLAVAAAAAAGLAAVKVVPAFALVRRHFASQSTLYAHAGAHGRHSLGFVAGSLLLWRRSGAPAGTSLAYSYMHVGGPALVLGLTGLALCWRKSWRYVLLVALTVLLVMGAGSHVDVLGVLRRLPGFHLIEGPGKYFSFPMVLLVACLGALALERLRHILSPRVFGAGLGAAGIISLGLWWTADYEIMRQVFPARHGTTFVAPDFCQVKAIGPGARGNKPLRANEYLSIRRQVGVVNWNSPILMPEHARPRILVRPDNSVQRNPEYFGEAWLAGGNGTARLRRVGANRIVVDVSVASAATVVLNFNADPAWTCERGSVGASDGLLSVRLGGPSKGMMELRYRPRLFRVGLAGSLCSAALIAIGVAVRLARRRASASREARSCIAQIR